MPGEPVISVRGEAVLEVAPEIARVEITVMARDAGRHRALDLLSRRSQRVTATIEGFGDAVEKLESGAVSVYPEFKEGKGSKGKERVAGYTAEGSLTVTVRDFTALGELVPAVASEEMVTVDGPAWLLRPASPVRREARLAAARDAIQRAREYAEAFGGRITGLVQAADTGLLSESREEPVLFAAARGARAVPAAAAGDDLAGFGFSPAKLIVSAQVEARFTMTEPALGD